MICIPDSVPMCSMQLTYSEKGVRRLTELLKSYQVALFDEEVLECFKVHPSPFEMHSLKGSKGFSSKISVGNDLAITINFPV